MIFRLNLKTDLCYVDIVICKAILFLLLKHLFWRQIDSSLNEFDQVWARIFLKIGLQGAKCKNSAYFTHCTPIYNWRPMLVAVVGRVGPSQNRLTRRGG